MLLYIFASDDLHEVINRSKVAKKGTFDPSEMKNIVS